MSEVQILSGYVPGAIGKIVELHGTYYHEHWDFGLFFEAKAAMELAELLNRFDETRDGFWVAVDEGEIVGGVAIDGGKAETEGARLRWFILAPRCQGRGTGNQLMQTALRFCDDAGFKRVYLTTFAGLDAARHLYEKWGFTLCDEEEGTHWGSRVVEQTFERVSHRERDVQVVVVGAE